MIRIRRATRWRRGDDQGSFTRPGMSGVVIMRRGSIRWPSPNDDRAVETASVTLQTHKPVAVRRHDIFCLIWFSLNLMPLQTSADLRREASVLWSSEQRHIRGYRRSRRNSRQETARPPPATHHPCIPAGDPINIQQWRWGPSHGQPSGSDASGARNQRSESY